ncbi:MAG TPA: polysaccharide deacetylase family protein [Candidatus Acidoferrum sp.]|jgi:peptidoglycan/xylan/chitin deacetylase (PgdA/CDA1 family)|nr:polysaccharide deacetylase family protein [Candidatus Acidoferrum sp.]
MNPWLIGAAGALGTAAGITAYGAAFPRAQVFGPTVCCTNSPRRLAITFDDGPNPAITPKLLDLLRQHHAHATFFLIGRFVREYQELVREIAARGHAIGNHTETHPNLFWFGQSQIRIELSRCSDAIQSATGQLPKWFRPPFGMRNPWLAGVARELDLRVVMWTLIPGDWRDDKPSEWLIRRMTPVAVRTENKLQNPLTRASYTGEILCLHDGFHRRQNGDRTHTLAALEHWLPRWRDLGLDFVTIDQAVRAPAP